MDLLGRKVCSAGGLQLRVANQQALLSRYNFNTWLSMGKFTELVPLDSRPEFQSLLEEGKKMSRTSLQASLDAVDSAARIVASGVTMRRISWLQVSGLPPELQHTIQDLPIEGQGLSLEKWTLGSKPQGQPYHNAFPRDAHSADPTAVFSGPTSTPLPPTTPRQDSNRRRGRVNRRRQCGSQGGQNNGPSATSHRRDQAKLLKAQQQRNLDNIVSQHPRIGGGKKYKKDVCASSDLEVKNTSPMSEQDSGILDVEDEDDDEEVPGAQDLVDFSPVYRCLHIYSVLGARETFENYYRKQRRKQARLVLQPPSNMHETLDGYRKYFNQIVGFFVVEDHILHTTQGLVNRAYIDELWEMALSKTIAALRTHSSYCSDPNLVLDLKNLIVLFADTLQGYGFPVNQLFDMLLEIRDQYSETLLKKWSGVFRNILDSDNYSPIPVANEELYKKIIGQFPFQDPELEKQPFPKKFPFSEFVPKVYNQIKEFIYACLKFSEDLHLSSTEVDDMIRKSTNLLLTRMLSNCLQTVIKKRNTGLTELVQIIINTTHLEKSCKFLEEFITNITNVLPETVHTTKLYGTTTFKDARHAAEEEIYTNLNQKIDQFLQLADYDWMVAEPGSKASDYLVDLIAFLRSTFAVFTHLPGDVDVHSTMSGKVAQTACMSACKHLSTSLMQLLLEAEVRQLTLGALQQFNLDVEECEQFARSGPVPGFQGDTLQLAFIDLRQLLDLFIQWDWSTYLADYGQPTCKYLRVNPTTALILLEKISRVMKDTSRKNNVFAQFRKNERDKQKLIDTVAKQLRSLINSHHL
nr:exocyst complex component 6B-like [Chelonoidis abingdonii]